LIKSQQVLVFAYAFHLICGIVYEPETDIETEIAVCPTCKDRVSQRMGYARMAELIRTPQNHPRNSIINLSKATNGVKNFINERRRSTFGGARNGPRRPSGAQSEASSVFSGVSQDGMNKIMQTRSQSLPGTSSATKQIRQFQNQLNIQNMDGLEKLSEMSESGSTPISQRNTQTSLAMPRTSVHEIIIEECDESKSQMSVEVSRKSQSSQTESNKLYPV